MKETQKQRKIQNSINKGRKEDKKRNEEKETERIDKKVAIATHQNNKKSTF